jgi:HAD superfamily phosphatase (TIGR01668 family)
MSFSLIPRYSFRKLTDITPEFLLGKGISLLLMDMDNTIAPYGMSEPDEFTRDWVHTMKTAGIELFIVSNSRRVGRTERFAEILSIGYVKEAKKPRTRALRRVLEIKGVEPKNAALVGDQIFTDTIAANCGGVLSLIVKPIAFTNIFLALRYWAEIPFRALCRGKEHRKHGQSKKGAKSR